MSLMPMNRGAYGQPNDSSVQLQDISSQRKLAEQLRAQGAQDIQGQMVSGHYIAPSWSQQLARVLQSGVGGYLEGDARNKEKDFNNTKNRKLADFLAGNKAQTVQQGTTETSTMPAYTPEQQDQFGSPLPNVQRQPVVTQTPNMVTETPEQVQERQRMAGYQLASQYQNDPAITLALGDLNHQRDRSERTADIADQRGYEGGVRKEERQFKVDDREDNQAFQSGENKLSRDQQAALQKAGFSHAEIMQLGQQKFAAGQQANSQAFTAGQNALNRDQQLTVAGLKGGVNSPQQKVTDAKDVIGILNQAAPLINQSTNSGLGNMIDTSAAFFGNSTKGAQSAASLKALEGSLVSKMPKMSGPQSDKDVLLYKQMAGQIGDPTLPAAQKKAAMDTILKLNSQYAGVPYQPLDFGDKAMTPSSALGGLPDQDAIAAEMKRRGL